MNTLEANSESSEKNDEISEHWYYSHNLFPKLLFDYAYECASAYKEKIKSNITLKTRKETLSDIFINRIKANNIVEAIYATQQG